MLKTSETGPSPNLGAFTAEMLRHCPMAMGRFIAGAAQPASQRKGNP